MWIPFQYQRPCQIEIRQLMMVMVIVSIIILIFQTLTMAIPSENPLAPLFSIVNIFQNKPLDQNSSTHFTKFDANSMSNFIPSSEIQNTPNKERGINYSLIINTTNFRLEKARNSENKYKPILVSPVEVFQNDSISGEMIANSILPPVLITQNISSRDRSGKKSSPNIKKLKFESSTNMKGRSKSGARHLKKRKKKQDVPLTTITEMTHALNASLTFSHSMNPYWTTVFDKQLLEARKDIENAPLVSEEHQLYAPAFRNLSMFKRSYELMERNFKVYVYQEGEKPIFHQPRLTGVYASEGWFMHLMDRNNRFIVNDPTKAHMFYIPFSSRLLELTLYVPGSHSQRNLLAYLNNYVDIISAKYPFWNRTGGADHFLVACHDWALYETGQRLLHSIRALCNADLSKGFILGKDISLPETYILPDQNPLENIGGNPPSKRPILAFFAGRMHGYLRPILLQYWNNTDPSMKFFEKIPRESKNEISYIQYMKTSKYCICPRGYDVNSPRIVEAILYHCVPVIISDNFVPPLFEILNWEAFSVFILEKDVPFLKNILTSISEEKYLSLQLGVKRIQQHFLWHNKPVKYDLFHMILHSVWFYRLHQVKIS